MALTNLKDAINNFNIVVIILWNNSNTKIHDLSLNYLSNIPYPY